MRDGQYAVIRLWLTACETDAESDETESTQWPDAVSTSRATNRPTMITVEMTPTTAFQTLPPRLTWLLIGPPR